MTMFQPLKSGDTIGIFSPSAPATATAKQRYIRGKEFLQSKGFQIIEGTLTEKKHGYRSGTPKERAEELNLLLRDSSIKMVMSSIGGTNSNSLLPYIDYEAFKNNPKIIVGYSDTTAILLALYAKTNIPTYYGPALIPSFGKFELIGTPYFPVIEKGDILLIEDSLKGAATVEKNFAMLKLHGIFDKVGGIILGKHELFDDEGTDKKPIDLLLEQLDGRVIPILADVDCAHTHPMFPLTIGKKIRLNTLEKSITCIEPWI